MDWETRNEQIPIGKHIIAGKSNDFYLLSDLITYGTNCGEVRLLRGDHGARRNVSYGHYQGKQPSVSRTNSSQR